MKDPQLADERALRNGRKYN